MKIAGAVILIIGLLMTIYTGFTYVTTEKVVKLGDIEITKEKDHDVNWQPYVGIGAMVVGAGVLFLSRKKAILP